MWYSNSKNNGRNHYDGRVLGKLPILNSSILWADTNQRKALHHRKQARYTIFELSNPNSQHYVGDDKKAIPPGEPADLVLIQWVPIYKALGRDKTIELVKQNVSLEEAMQLIPEDMRPKTKRSNGNTKRKRIS